MALPVYAAQAAGPKLPRALGMAPCTLEAIHSSSTSQSRASSSRRGAPTCQGAPLGVLQGADLGFYSRELC